MRSRLVPTLAALFLIVGPAHAGQIWTDANGDGLPDEGTPPILVFPSDLLTADIWIDTQSFTFTSFRVTVGLDPVLGVMSASYVISGGTNAPVDSTSRARSLIFAGSGYITHGIHRIATLSAHVDQCPSLCGAGEISPIIGPADSYPTRLTSGGGTQQYLFQTRGGTLFGCLGDPDGACCLPNGNCFISLRSECAEGLWFCGAPCSNCSPTGVGFEPFSWGRVKSIFR